MYGCVLRKYLVSSFFLSGPNFTYRAINNCISLSSIVRLPGENKEVPQTGIRRNRKPEVYAQFWSGSHLSNWERNWRATLLWFFAEQIVREWMGECMKLAEKPVTRFGTRSVEFRTFYYRVINRFATWPCKNLSISSAFSLYYFWSFFLASI